MVNKVVRIAAGALTAAVAMGVSLSGCGGSSNSASDAAAVAMLEKATSPPAAKRAAAAAPAPLPANVSAADAALQLMDYAEQAYPSLFPGQQPTQNAGPFAYRYYAPTGIYLGVAVTAATGVTQYGVYVMGGPFGTSPHYVGQLTDFITPMNLAGPTSWTPAGIDYGLKRKCIRTIAPAQPNFYYDNADCPGGYPTDHYWTTAVETETMASYSTASSCSGPTAQSALVNGSSSPVAESWTGSKDAGYVVEIKTDYANTPNPCTPMTWTWVPFMENWVGGGPLPNPNTLVTHFAAKFDRLLPQTSGSTRAFAGFGGQWTVADAAGSPVLATVSIEIDFYTDPNWGKTAGTPFDVIGFKQVGASYYVALDGARLYPALAVPLGAVEFSALTVNWAAVIQHLIDERMIPAPVNGWSNSNAATSASFVGTEVRNDLPGSGGPMADLVLTGFEEGAF